MHLISFINFADIELLDKGYKMTDQLASVVESYLALFEIPYVSPFACIGIVPDNQGVGSVHPLNAFGDTQLILRPSLAEELQISCKTDIQNASATGLSFWTRNHKTRPDLKIVEMSKIKDKLEYVQRLASASTGQNYPEARLYRGLGWSDIDGECADRLKRRWL